MGFGGGSPAPAPQPTPEEIAQDRLKEEQAKVYGIDRQIRQDRRRRGARSLLVSTGLGLPGVTTNSGG